MDVIEKAEWTTEIINSLPDSSFAYIEPGGSKDTVGKTVPRILRHFPIKNAEGVLVTEYVAKSIAAVETAPLSKRTLERVKSKLEAMLATKAEKLEADDAHEAPCGCGDEHCSGTRWLKDHGVQKMEGESDDARVEKYITHHGDSWKVHAESGRVLGTHGSKADAVAQLRAVEWHKAHPTAKDETTEKDVHWPVDHSRFRGSSLTDAGERAPNQPRETKKMVDVLKDKEPGSRVQTLIFDKEKYPSAKEAKAWASDHGFSAGKVDETGGSLRIRQETPGKFDRIRTISLTEGVQATIGFMKKSIEAVKQAFFLTNSGRLAFKAEVLQTAECEPIAEQAEGTIWRVKIADQTFYFAEQDGLAAHIPFYGMMETMKHATFFVPVVKASDGTEQRYTLSVVYPASKKDAPEPDFHGDVMSEGELEKSAWGFMGKGTDRIGLMHRPGTSGAGKVVESYIWRGPEWKMKDAGGKDQSVSPGDWVMGIVWSPEAWAAIKSGQITGLSLQGAARKEAF